MESPCKHCGGKQKVETKQAIVACTTCGAEDLDNIPFKDNSYQSFEVPPRKDFRRCKAA